jgi:hypothetical protein
MIIPFIQNGAAGNPAFHSAALAPQTPAAEADAKFRREAAALALKSGSPHLVSVSASIEGETFMIVVVRQGPAKL